MAPGAGGYGFSLVFSFISLSPPGWSPEMCIRDRGYIYSVKGKGSFVADSSRMRAGKLKEWKGRFTAFVEEGIKIGVTAEDMTGLVEETFCGRMAGLVEETFCGHMTERGDGHD